MEDPLTEKRRFETEWLNKIGCNADPWFSFLPFEQTIKKKQELENMLLWEEETIRSTLTCLSCNSNRIMVTTAQERGLDEGMTTKAKCLQCDYSWKEL